MPVPTTNVSFSSIQTEFGGSNPITLSAEYYRGGPNVPSNQTTSSVDGTAIPTSPNTLIRVGMFRGLTKAASGTITASGNGIFFANDVQYDNFPSNASLFFQPNGQVTANGSGNTSISPWFSPTTTNIGSSYWIRATLNSSIPPATIPAGSAFNSWLPLNINQGWSIARSSAGLSSCTMTLEISTTSNGSNIVATYTGVQVSARTFEGPPS